MAGHKGEGRILYGEPEILYGGSYLAVAINFFTNSPKYKLLMLFIMAILSSAVGAVSAQSHSEHQQQHKTA